ncbi:hypothetical protein Sjap_020561 [Stephania japonica]|uniref:Uncharacterized protein n=1 Tax=Stephania japonica TaxID=461633 RepID=A0AAP0F6G1_9MAGN
MSGGIRLDQVCGPWLGGDLNHSNRLDQIGPDLDFDCWGRYDCRALEVSGGDETELGLKGIDKVEGGKRGSAAVLGRCGGRDQRCSEGCRKDDRELQVDPQRGMN